MKLSKPNFVQDLSLKDNKAKMMFVCRVISPGLTNSQNGLYIQQKSKSKINNCTGLISIEKYVCHKS